MTVKHYTIDERFRDTSNDEDRDVATVARTLSVARLEGEAQVDELPSDPEDEGVRLKKTSWLYNQGGGEGGVEEEGEGGGEGGGGRGREGGGRRSRSCQAVLLTSTDRERGIYMYM